MIDSEGAGRSALPRRLAQEFPWGIPDVVMSELLPLLWFSLFRITDTMTCGVDHALRVPES